MRSLKDIVLGPPEADSRTLTIHLIVKAVVVVAILLLMWGLEYQAEVVYEAF